MLHMYFFFIALPPFDKYPKNASVFLHQTVYFPCCIQAMPPAMITWYKNEQPLILDEARMTILPSGALEIDSVTILDEGAYHCVASNPEKSRKSEVGYLIINRNSGKLYFNIYILVKQKELLVLCFPQPFYLLSFFSIIYIQR